MTAATGGLEVGNRGKIIVVGAGIAGLTLSYKLCSSGHEVVLVEKEDKVGGLARSFTYDDYTFDAGPHRFYTEDPEVLGFIHEVLENDHLVIGRKSGVRMFDRYFEWPLKGTSLLRMPLRVLFSVVVDMLKKDTRSGRSFESYILNNYGKTLYEIFFKPYTEKFLGMPCTQISRDWAVTGIDRAVIDSSIQVNDLFALAKTLVHPRPRLDFIYPRGGGVRVFSEKLKRKITDNNGILLLKSEVTGIVRKNRTIEKIIINKREYDCDLLVWTGSLEDLSALLGVAPAGLEYLSLLMYNYCLDSMPLCRYQWCYFGSDDVPFNRVTIPVYFDPSLAPRGKSGICVEVTCRKGNSLWQSPEMIEPGIREALRTNVIINGQHDIRTFHIEKLSNAYPVYSLDYAGKLTAIMSELQKFTRLKMLGRTGTFWYNNMDHSIKAALDMYHAITAAI